MKTDRRFHRLVVFTFAAVCAVGTGWATNTWQAVDGEWSGDWSETAHWSAGHEPTAEEDVLLPAHDTNYAVTATNAISVGSFTIGTQDASVTGTVTFLSKTYETNCVACDCIVYNKGVLTHDGPYSVSTVAGIATKPHLNFKVGGDMTVNSGASVHANGKGCFAGAGPAAGEGAGHGGSGGEQTVTCYGSVRYPMTYGSGGRGTSYYNQGHGGGAIYLDVGGTLTLNAALSVIPVKSWKGTQNLNLSGAGGSVFIKAGALVGAGGINAYGRYGSGGRVAIHLTKSDDWSAYTGTIDVSRTSKGGAGTIYKESMSQHGVGVFSSTSGGTTKFDANVTDWQQPFEQVAVNQTLSIGDGMLTVCDKLSVQSSGALSTKATGGLVFAPTNGGTTVVSIASGRTCSAKTLVCSVPGGTLQFDAGGTLTVPANGTVTLKGAEGEPLVLKSKTAGSKWNLSMGADVTPDIRWLDVSDSTAILNPVTAYDSENGGNNTNWNFVETPKPGATMMWTGREDSQLPNANNWDPSRDILPTDVLVFTNGCARYPVVTKSFVANKIRMANKTTITLSSADLSVTNAIECFGQVVGTGTLRIVGDCASADLNGGHIETLAVDKEAGGTLAFAHGFDVGTFICRATNELSLCFAPGEKVTAASMRFDGFSTAEDGVTAITNLTLASAADGAPWRLALGGVADIRGALVKGSDASAGKTVRVGTLCANGGNNVNWDFSEGSVALWKGGTKNKETDFRTATNWQPEGVPGAGTAVIISPESGTATVSLGAGDPVTVASVFLGGRGGTASLTVNAKLTVNESVDLASGATAIFNYATEPIEVGGDFFVRDGATLRHSGPSTVERNRINLKVGRNMTVELNGVVTASGFGYQYESGPGMGTASGSPGSHGGLGYAGSKYESIDKAYGSIFEPRRYGSGVNNHGWSGANGGGAIELDVAGTLMLYGNVTADSGFGSNAASAGYGAGGSILIRAGTFAGSGKISASAVSGGGGGGTNGGGGRIALYQRTAKDWSGFAGHAKVSASGLVSGGAGTVYRQLPGDKERGGEITVSGVAGTPFPMLAYDGGTAKKGYRDVTLTVDASAGSGVFVNTNGWNAAADKLRLQELNLKTTSSKLNMNGSTFRVTSRAHKDGSGWATTPDKLVLDGEVIWGAPGMLMTVR